MRKFNNFDQTTHTIGFLLDSFYDEISTEIWRNLTEIALIENINLLCFVGGNLNSVFENNYQKNSVFDLINIKNVDGIIALTGSIGNFIDLDELKEYFKKFKNIPIISIGAEFDDTTSILIDNLTGMYELVSHLIKVHNCKNIAFIKGPESSYDAIERFEGYKKALLENNICINNNIIIPGDFTRISGIKAGNQLLYKQINNIDAVVGANDSMIINALKVFKKNKILFPDNILIAGFDNIIESKNIVPSLTTVSQPCYDIARISIDIMMKKIKKKIVPDKIVLPSKLIIRESCGCNISPVSESKQYKEKYTNHKNFNNFEFRGQSLILHEINENLVSGQNINDLKKILRNNLYKLGINSYYLNFYDNNYLNYKCSELICFDKETNDISINNFKIRFPTIDIIPGGIKKIKSKKIFIILALFIKDEIFGYAVFEKGSIEEVIYESLATQISIFLKRLYPNKNKLNRNNNLLLEIVNQKNKNRCLLSKKYRNSSLTKNESKIYFNKLIDIMKNEKLYLNPDINMYQLAARLSISYNHLSQIINENSKLNFNDFVNSFRIERVKMKLVKLNKVNILEIALGTGFNSKSSFYNVFKKHLSMTPKQYIKKMSTHI